MKRVPLVGLVVLLVFIQGCGFHLRNYGNLPPAMRTVYIEGNNSNSAFLLQFRRSLKAIGIEIRQSAQNAPIRLQVLNDRFEQRLVTISGNTQVRSYRLSYTVTYQIKDGAGRIIYGPMSASTTTTYSTSDTQLLGDSDMLSQQQQILQRTVIGQIFHQLNAPGTWKIVP